jgi:hypothetical protein
LSVGPLRNRLISGDEICLGVAKIRCRGRKPLKNGGSTKCPLGGAAKREEG